MEAPKSTPLWLHIVRLLVLVAAAAGVAWVVASAQRRAMQARASAPHSSPDSASEDVGVAGELDFETMPMTVEFDSIEMPIELSSAVAVRLELPETLEPHVPDVDAALPDATLEFGQDLSLSLPTLPYVPLADPYIGSSKSMVFTPETFGPGDPRQRHGKP